MMSSRYCAVRSTLNTCTTICRGAKAEAKKDLHQVLMVGDEAKGPVGLFVDTERSDAALVGIADALRA